MTKNRLKFFKVIMSSKMHENNQRELVTNRQYLVDILYGFYRFKNVNTFLREAIQHLDLQQVLKILKLKINPILLDMDAADEYEMHLHQAIETRDLDSIRSMVETGADLSCRDSDGNNALHLTCLLNDFESFEILTGKKDGLKCVNLDAANYDGGTCVHLAAKNDNINILVALVKLGANINSRELTTGNTILHTLVLRKKHEFFCLVVETFRKILDIRVRNYAGHKVSTIAKSTPFSETLTEYFPDETVESDDCSTNSCSESD